MFIIIRKNPDGSYAGAQCPCVHPSLTAANLEAVRLARAHVGNEFFVMQGVSAHKVDLVPVTSRSLPR